MKLDESKIGFSNEELVVIIQAALEKGASTRMKALGCSMTPFIKNEDILTISPISKAPAGIGKVVTFTYSKRKKLVVHRILRKQKNCYLIKGDNCGKADGWVPESNILGIVTKIERDGRMISFGLGRERYIIAFFSRIRLIPFVFIFWRLIPIKIRKFIKCLIHT